MSDTSELPPWEPIADWLARLPQEPQEDSKQDERLAQNATQNAIRKRYELEAKTIAYDIAIESEADADD